METPAATVYEIHLRVRGRLPNWLLLPVLFVRNVVGGWTGLSDGDRVAPAVIEVVRRSDGTRVGCVAAGSHYYDQVELLAFVRRSLESDTSADFLATWHLKDQQL